MNVTELARILKVTPQELRDILPQVGFDIGQRAIKIDNRTAQKIIKQWPKLIKEYEAIKAKVEKDLDKAGDEEVAEKKVITIPKYITIRELASLAQLPVSKVLSELMKNGVFASMNERIDYETAAIIGPDLGLEVKLDESLGETALEDRDKLDKILKKEDKKKMQIRPPVVVVMGHVDHGKTKLLDTIRKTNVIEGEAGGITQHIGAYQAERKGKLITFIDTPGHEAFTAMRSRGAKVADVAILVVAADDGVKPQTIEALRIIEAAKVPFVVAINKIDKDGADVNRTKQGLSTELNITPEDWGGQTICASVSAMTGDGIDDLLDMILLVAEVEEKDRQANPEALAAGTVIESHVDKGAGPVATILIQNGTLRTGDQICFGGKICGKVRALKNYKGEKIDEAGPSVPAEVLGLKISPVVGDVLEVGEGKKVKSAHLAKAQVSQEVFKNGLDTEDESDKRKKVNLIIKSDVLGSAEAIEESLEKINTKDVAAKIVNKGLGNITEGDVERAEAAGAQLIGFNVNISPKAQELARNKKVEVKLFNIIYDLIEDVRTQMQSLLEPELKRVDLGKLKVLAIFRTESASQIVGGKILDGEAQAGAKIEVLRDKQVIAQGKMKKLQAGKADVSQVEKDQEY